MKLAYLDHIRKRLYTFLLSLFLRISAAYYT